MNRTKISAVLLVVALGLLKSHITKSCISCYLYFFLFAPEILCLKYGSFLIREVEGVSSSG